MANRLNPHNEKRKARFVEAGITEADIKFAIPAFVGEGEGECALCDHAIGNLFSLEFQRPDGSAPIVFDPVGSVCITDWIKAMPESPEREAALARIKDAEKKMQQLKADKKAEIEESEAERALLGALQPGDRRSIEAFLALPLNLQTGPLEDIANKVLKFGCFASKAQWGFFQNLLREAQAKAPKPVAPQRAPTPPNGQPRPQALDVQQFVPACPKCKGPTVVRQGTRGAFFGCVAYPKCSSITPIYQAASQEPARAYQAPPLPPAGQRALPFDDPAQDDGEPPF